MLRSALGTPPNIEGSEGTLPRIPKFGIIFGIIWRIPKVSEKNVLLPDFAVNPPRSIKITEQGVPNQAVDLLEGQTCFTHGVTAELLTFHRPDGGALHGALFNEPRLQT